MEKGEAPEKREREIFHVWEGTTASNARVDLYVNTKGVI